MNIGSSELQRTESLPHAFFAVAARWLDRPAQWHRLASGYVPTTYRELAGRIRRVASALIRLGVQPGERIALLMEGRPEWAVADYAILSIGAVTVPLYCASRVEDMAYVLRDAGVSMVLASGGKPLRSLLAALPDCPDVQSVYAVEAVHDDARLHPFSELEGGLEAEETDTEALNARLQALTRQTLATLVYTSGTTGNFKGTMLSHGNFLSNLEAVPEIIRFEADDRMLSVLPLAHILERFASHFMPYSFGLSVAFAERPDRVAKNLTEATPTLMVAVPRLLEVMQSRILGRVTKQSPMAQRLFRAYVGRRGGASMWRMVCRRLLEGVVGRKIRDQFGGRLRLMVSGGAPLAPDVASFFEALGLPVLEGYGLTETVALTCVNPVNDRRIGTVGKAVKGVELRIAEDGEILVRGGSVMRGYWRLPEATEAALVDGWFHTGDIGEIDADGYLRITDRKKDIIVNSGGKNIAPQRIENLLLADVMIDQVVIYGDRKPHLVALIIPSQEHCLHWARAEDLPETEWRQLAVSEALHKMLHRRVHDALKSFPQHEQVRRIMVHAEPLTIDSGLLTPTLKVKRHKVYERFRDELEGLY